MLRNAPHNARGKLHRSEGHRKAEPFGVSLTNQLSQPLLIERLNMAAFVKVDCRQRSGNSLFRSGYKEYAKHGF